LASQGGGLPDLLVYYRNTLFILECKTGSLSPSRRKLSADQIAFKEKGWPVIVVNNEIEALNAVGAINQEK
jgi:hypothetical protein